MQEQTQRSREDILGFMVSLSVAANDARSAEGYFLKLLAFCKLVERNGKVRVAA